MELIDRDGDIPVAMGAERGGEATVGAMPCCSGMLLMDHGICKDEGDKGVVNIIID